MQQPPEAWCRCVPDAATRLPIPPLVACSAAEGSEDEEEEEDQQEAAAADSGVAAATLLRDARRLGEETARMCRPELQQALRGGGVPLDDLLRLLRLLHRLAAAGTGRLLEPGDTVSWVQGTVRNEDGEQRGLHAACATSVVQHPAAPVWRRPSTGGAAAARDDPPL